MSKLNMAAIRIKVFIDSFLTREKGAVDIVAIVILIAVAVVLALLFKEQIGKLLETMIGQIGDKASKALDSI
ncbi:MAG: Flp1 family type IVb pilin [Acutalibacteraceae bacterium]